MARLAVHRPLGILKFAGRAWRTCSGISNLGNGACCTLYALAVGRARRWHLLARTSSACNPLQTKCLLRFWLILAHRALQTTLHIGVVREGTCGTARAAAVRRRSWRLRFKKSSGARRLLQTKCLVWYWLVLSLFAHCACVLVGALGIAALATSRTRAVRRAGRLAQNMLPTDTDTVLAAKRLALFGLEARGRAL